MSAVTTSLPGGAIRGTYAAVRRVCTRLRADECGFSLIELLVVAAILPVVLAALLGPFDLANQQTPKNIEYSHAVGDASTGLQRMILEIRDAYRLKAFVGVVGNANAGNEIEFNAILNGSDQDIEYACDQPYPNNGNPNWQSYQRCLRVSVATGGTLPALSTGTVVVDRVLNGTAANPVFTISPNPLSPTYISLLLQVPARGERATGQNHTITLNDGATLRNFLVGS